MGLYVDPPANDREFKVVTIERVESGKEGAHEITSSDGWSFYVPKYDGTPKVGDVAKFYGRGIGHVVRGLVIDGKTVFYRTPSEQEDVNRRELLKSNAKYRDEYLAHKEQHEKDFQSLPPKLQSLITRMRDERGPDWCWEPMGEAYFLFICTQAVKIAEAFKGNPEGLVKWTKLRDFEEQRKLVPELSDGHSGNTFGAAASLAHDLITEVKA